MLAKITWLPDNGPVAASIAGGRHHYGWDVTRYFLQSLLDVERKHLWVTVRSKQRQGSRRMPRPGEVPGPDELNKTSSRPTRPAVTVAQLARHLPE